MPEKIEDRIKGLENIIHGIHHNIELLNFIALNLHSEPYNLNNNKGLLWIWSNTMALQIIDFYKLISRNEKFSFTKIINVAKDSKLKANYEILQTQTEELTNLYDDQNYEVVRSKYLAHQDLNAPEIQTDLKGINIFSKKVIELFQLFSEQFNYDITEFDGEIESSFNEIFNTIDEYEKIKGYLIAKLLLREKVVEISDIQEIIGDA